MGQGVSLSLAVSVRQAAKREHAKTLSDIMAQMPQCETATLHTFGPGVYIREAALVAGTTAIGHYHLFEHTVVLTSGTILVKQDFSEPIRLTAPCTFVGKCGRKTVYAETDARVLNIYATDIRDVALLEELLVSRVEAVPLLSYRETVAVSQIQQVPMGTYKFKIIKNKGLFATASISCGERICSLRLDDTYTPFFSALVASERPNAKIVNCTDGALDLVAIEAIDGVMGGNVGAGITVTYNDLMKRKNLCLSSGSE